MQNPPSDSSADARRRQSSIRRDTKLGLVARAEARYSMAFLSSEFWDTSRNWRLIDYMPGVSHYSAEPKSARTFCT